MNKKQILVLVLAIVTVSVIVLFNLWDLISVLNSNAATITYMIDPRPMLVEIAIGVIFFGTLFVLFKTPRKKD
jgi:hypothetical protein